MTNREMWEMALGLATGLLVIIGALGVLLVLVTVAVALTGAHP